MQLRVEHCSTAHKRATNLHILSAVCYTNAMDGLSKALSLSLPVHH